MFPGQYFDQESGLHYNYFRDYDPRTGRYIEPDPLLQPNNLLTKETSFLVPVIAFYNLKMLHPYNYATGSPLVNADPSGLGMLAALKCLYYGKKIAIYGEQCNKECPNDYEGEIKFIDRYTSSGQLGFALIVCTCQKAGPELCANWLGSCYRTPYSGFGPKTIPRGLR